MFDDSPYSEEEFGDFSFTNVNFSSEVGAVLTFFGDFLVSRQKSY
jgi:hypothetical protein